MNPVYQVFRNWNLNQRRINEWQMLISGGAVSEKRGVPRDPDSLQPGVPSGWTALTACRRRDRQPTGLGSADAALARHRQPARRQQPR